MPDAAMTLGQARRVHFVGVGGSGMSALASLLLGLGKVVSGSDAADGEVQQGLRRAGARIHVGHASGQVAGADYVIRSSAIPPDNSEVEEAVKIGVPCVKLADAVGELMADRPGAAIAGTHGKTTTTALLAWLLDRGGLDPLALIGGDALNFGGSARVGSGPMVVEADEYDERFLRLRPRVAVVTSVEPDHLDFYGTFERVVEAFRQFAKLVPADGKLIVCADDPVARELGTLAQRETYGTSDQADWRVSDYAVATGGTCGFSLSRGEERWDARMQVPGLHNACNAAAAVASANAFGVDPSISVSALAIFKGTRRRIETIGCVGGVRIVDDYAHHPTAVAATLATARAAFLERGALWTVFQPHTVHRTLTLLQPFARSFSDADHVLVLPIYQPTGRQPDDSRITSDDLVRAMRGAGHPDARLAADFDDVVAALEKGAASGDVILTMGAGDVTRLAPRLVRELRPHA